ATVFPRVPGIDFAGVVEASDEPRYAPGDRVILTGWRVGETHWGGYGEKARVQGDWLVPMPEGMRTRWAMAVGTAGLTAMLAVQALEDHGLAPGAGEVLVTGAAGGVSSVAVALLAGLGHEVVAVTGRGAAAGEYLRGLGAAGVLGRAELEAPASAPLEDERWAGAVSAIGGPVLARLLRQMRYGASVASIGLAGGAEFRGDVRPFILRGVNLLGIESVMQPFAARQRAWARLAELLPMDKLEPMVVEAPLAEVPALGAKILRGEVRGRVVVDVRA
ncbi:MAG TPA: acryloyl-CoA reductase, partial [Aliiroseovarius sp.]|nr:acryloyl-CoA reductase [Aliiroseovarius sp.]